MSDLEIPAEPTRASVLDASSIHTQGSNFLHAVQTAADPRTGQFNMAITLPLGLANFLAGPSWPFTLSYNALASQLDSGFGLGWSLQYSQLTRQQDVWTLQLSSGEQFSVDLEKSNLQPGGRLAFLDYKLLAMQVSVEKDDQPGGELTFRVLHKSGEQELLRRVSGRGDAYVLHELRSPEGRRLHFDWLTVNEVSHLREVRDEQRVLARYDRLQRKLTLEPGSSDESTVQFLLANGELARLLLPEVAAPFTFKYSNQSVGSQRLRLPIELSGPLGATDFINWSQTPEDSHRLPDKAPIDYMPRVVSWLHSDSPRAPALLRRYAWVGSRNYLGGGSPQRFDWQPGRDSLYRLMTRYEYSSSETQLGGDAAALRSLQACEQTHPGNVQLLLTSLMATGVVTPLTTLSRTWDRHHLLIKELTVVGDAQTLRETTYGVDYDKHWLEQTPQCQLPHAIEATYLDRGTGTHCSERETFEYDAFGNTLKHRLPTQVEEVSEYYPASGDLPGCPHDASGMVRFLKHKTVYPAPDCPGDAPLLRTRYTYESLASLIPGDPEHAVVCLEELVNARTNEVLEHTWQSYERTDTAHYGRLNCVVSTLNGIATTTLFTYSLEREPGEPALLRTRTVVKGFEGTDSSTSASEEHRSLSTGLSHCEIDAAGTRTRFFYDALGRVTRTVIADGTPYQVERTCTYHIDDDFIAQHAPRLGDELEVRIGLEETDASGQRKRTWLDGSGRPVLTQLEELDHRPDVFADMTRTGYDAWGRAVEHISLDWSDDGGLLFSHGVRNDYDDWGNLCRYTDATGLVTHTRSDPTRRQLSRWQESAAGVISSKQVSTLNVAGSPLQTTLVDDQGQTVRTTFYERDGLDRVVEQRISAPGSAELRTRFEHDHYDRICVRHEHFIQQDVGYVRSVRWTYAGHSDGDHPASVSVDVIRGDQR